VTLPSYPRQGFSFYSDNLSGSPLSVLVGVDSSKRRDDIVTAAAGTLLFRFAPTARAAMTFEHADSGATRHALSGLAWDAMRLEGVKGQQMIIEVRAHGLVMEVRLSFEIARKQ